MVVTRDGTPIRVKCRHCDWGGAKGVAANATRCAKHFHSHHAPKRQPEFVDDSDSEPDPEPDEPSQATQASQSSEASEASSSSAIKKRKLTQSPLALYADKAFSAWQQDNVLNKLVFFQVVFTSCALCLVIIPHTGIRWAVPQLFGRGCIQGTVQSTQGRLPCALQEDSQEADPGGVPTTAGPCSTLSPLLSSWLSLQARVAAELKSWKTCVMAVDGWKDDEGQETLGATALSCSHKHKPLVLLVEQQHCRQVLDTLHHPFLSHLLSLPWIFPCSSRRPPIWLLPHRAAPLASLRTMLATSAMPLKCNQTPCS